MTEQEYYAKIKAEYEASTDVKLVEWARPYFEGTKKPNGKDKYVICPVSDRAADDIAALTDSDVRGFNHIIACDNIRHIDKKHGIKGKSNQSMRDVADLGRIAYVLNNYDYIESRGEKIYGVLNKRGEASNLIKFVKRINGYVITAEAVTDSPKKKALYIRSVYKAKTIQKESRMDDENSPRPHVQNAYGSSTSILPQDRKNVKTSSENNSAYVKISVGELAERRRREQQQAKETGKNSVKNSPNKGSSGR